MLFRLFQGSSALFLTGSMSFFGLQSITPLFIHVFIYSCVGEEENENKNKKNKNKKNKNKGDDKDNKKNNKNKNGKRVFIHGVHFIVLLNLIPSLKLILCWVSSISFTVIFTIFNNFFTSFWPHIAWISWFVGRGRVCRLERLTQKCWRSGFWVLYVCM